MANTVAYETPVSGATAPTAAQSKTKNTVNAVITGDNSATSFTITHNWNLSAAQLAAGFPEVSFQALSNAAYAANPFVSSATANAVVVTCVAFTGAILRARVKRPHSLTV